MLLFHAALGRVKWEFPMNLKTNHIISKHLLLLSITHVYAKVRSIKKRRTATWWVVCSFFTFSWAVLSSQEDIERTEEGKGQNFQRQLTVNYGDLVINFTKKQCIVPFFSLQRSNFSLNYKYFVSKYWIYKSFRNPNSDVTISNNY